MNRRTLIAAVASTAMVGKLAAQPAPRALSADAEAFIDEMVVRHQFDRDALRALFTQVRVQNQVLGATASHRAPGSSIVRRS